MPRREFTKTVKKQIIARSTNKDGQICCEGCNLILGLKKYDIDHTHPDGLTAEKRKLTAEDGQLLCKQCHKAKTKRDVQAMRKADRVRNRHTGATAPKQTIKGKPLSKAQKRLSVASVLPELPKRSLFKPKER